MHSASHHVNGVQYVAHMPTDEELRSTLSDVRRYVGVRLIAKATGVSYRTLYRHLEDSPPEMDLATRTSLEDLFDETGLISDYDRKALRDAAAKVEALASARAAEDARASRGREARTESKRAPKKTPGRRRKSE